MSLTALILVLTGALCHALWNVAAKRAAGGVAFVWLYGLVSVIFAIPVAFYFWSLAPQTFDLLMWLAVSACAVIHVGYSLVLHRAYQESDFSVVYPVARGVGPMFSVLAAIILLGENPGFLGLFSILAILLGLFVCAGIKDSFRGNSLQRRTAGIVWGIITALFIASYTTVDGWAIKSLGMAPILFYTAGLVLRTVLLTPFALVRQQEVVQQLKLYKKEAIIVGLLSPLAYLLILFALQLAPLSYVAPLREVSMLAGLAIGVHLLKEKITRSQIAGVLIMLSGVTGLAFA